MSDLDKKLEELLGEGGAIKHCCGQSECNDSAADIRQIKQAFIDAGWYNEPKRVTCMTRIVCRNCSHETTYEKHHLFPNDIRTIGAIPPVAMTKEEWERQAIRDGWKKPEYIGPDLHITRANYTDEQLKAISEEWSKPHMTGQEFYDRFEKEYSTSYVLMSKDGIEGEIKVNPLEATKRAAGIE